MIAETQAEFRRADGGRSQNEKLRDYLMAHPCQWVPMVDLGKVIHAWAVHSRVSDCRERFGMHIETRQRTNPQTGQREPSYFYDPELPGNFGCRRNKAGAEV